MHQLVGATRAGAHDITPRHQEDSWLIGARRHCWLIDVKVEAIQLELRVLRVITSHAGSHTHEVDQVDGLRDEIDDRDEPVDVDVLVGEPTAHDVARVGGKLHPGASEVTVQLSLIHI